MKDFKNIKGDIFGGITAGIIALPLSLAFGVSSGLGPIAGLYGAIIVCLFATIFGGTPTQISGPTGPMTVVIATMIATHPNNLKLIIATMFLGGFIQLMLGLAKVGKFIKYVPYPVISGFMSGIGAIILLLQFNQILGLNFKDSPIMAIPNIISNFGNINHHSLLLGLLTILIVFLTPKKISKKVPSALLALVIVTLFSAVSNFNVATIGAIPKAFPTIQLGLISLKEFNIALPLALTLGILGSIDSLLTSLVADSLTKTKHDSNKELIGQGLGNMVASIFGGLAGAGATMRTVVNIKAGGHSRLSGVIHSLLLICIILFLAPFAAKIPLAVLGGILIKVGLDIIDYKFLKIIKFAPKSDIAVMIAVFLITVLYDLIFAVGVGIVLASILFAIKVSKQMDIEIKDVDNDSENFIEERGPNNTIIANINGVLFFGTASILLTKIESLFEHDQIIINCSKVKTIDISAIFALEDLLLRLKSRGVTVLLVLNNKKLGEKILSLGLNKVISADAIFYDVEKAINMTKN